MQKSAIAKKKSESVGELLRFWRRLKRISQMDLALDAGVSSRHLSFVETGRSRPSRDLVLKLSRALKLPLRHCNAFLAAAGYASEFSEAPFDGEKMAMVRQALARMLETHNPYPAFVVDTGYRILMANAGFKRLLHFIWGDSPPEVQDNVIRLTFAENGLKNYIRDWPTVQQFILARLWEEVAATQNPDLMALYEEVSTEAGSGLSVPFHPDGNLPIMGLALEKDGITARFFTTLTTLGTPLDQTAQELRIESLFPADEQTKVLFARLDSA